MYRCIRISILNVSSLTDNKVSLLTQDFQPYFLINFETLARTICAYHEYEQHVNYFFRKHF